MRDYESVWNALEEWRERTAGDVTIESVGAGWLCRLQAPRRGIAPALCHGADATTAVEGALAVLLSRNSATRTDPGSRTSSAVRGSEMPHSQVSARFPSQPEHHLATGTTDLGPCDDGSYRRPLR